MVSRPLVITTAFSYGPNELWPLIHSLQQYAPTAEVLVLTAAEDLDRLAPLIENFASVSLESVELPPRVIRGRLAIPRKLGSRTKRWLRQRQQQWISKPSIAIEQPRRLGLSTAQAHFLIRRFFWAQAKLKQPRWINHDAVMLCDSRDVVVQGNPFESLGDNLVTGEEFNLFDNCPMNRRWIRQTYGRELEKNLLGRPALCAGVVAGSRRQMQLYLDLFCEDTLNVMRSHGTSCLANLDQAIHNKILRKPSDLQLAISLVNGLIATMGCIPAERCKLPDGPGPVEVMGAVPKVIHQYDRHPLLSLHVQARHGRGSNCSSSNCSSSNGSSSSGSESAGSESNGREPA
jgi:hypothetical protein